MTPKSVRCAAIILEIPRGHPMSVEVVGDDHRLVRVPGGAHGATYLGTQLQEWYTTIGGEVSEAAGMVSGVLTPESRLPTSRMCTLVDVSASQLT